MLCSARSVSQRVEYEPTGDIGARAIGVLMLFETPGKTANTCNLATLGRLLRARSRSLEGALARMEFCLQAGSLQVPGAQRFDTLNDGDPGYRRPALLAAAFSEIRRPVLGHTDLLPNASLDHAPTCAKYELHRPTHAVAVLGARLLLGCLSDAGFDLDH